ncbi:hypothetical protein Acr_28g0004680 [Actinidia rufa]|uniref:Uncharacterized protein n=1 Tax=Actinidia rufa TaxID=165716 RepID=A0A7J0H9G6_9ERIC|nr:hypothetical protein Acr_28g0004680 [Actinidia rufa]
MGLADPPKNRESTLLSQKRDDNAPQYGQRCVPNRDGSVPVATVRTLMLQIWDFGRLGLQASDLGLASGSPTVHECRERDSRWLAVAGIAVMVSL